MKSTFLDAYRNIEYAAYNTEHHQYLVQSWRHILAVPGCLGLPSYTRANAEKVVPNGLAMLSRRTIKMLDMPDADVIKTLRLRPGAVYWLADTAFSGFASTVQVQDGRLFFDGHAYTHPCTLRLTKVLKASKKGQDGADIDVNAD